MFLTALVKHPSTGLFAPRVFDVATYLKKYGVSARRGQAADNTPAYNTLVDDLLAFLRYNEPYLEEDDDVTEYAERREQFDKRLAVVKTQLVQWLAHADAAEVLQLKCNPAEKDYNAVLLVTATATAVKTLKTSTEFVAQVGVTNP